MYVLFISTILLLATGRKILVLTLITAMTSVLTSQLVKREAPVDFQVVICDVWDVDILVCSHFL